MNYTGRALRRFIDARKSFGKSLDCCFIIITVAVVVLATTIAILSLWYITELACPIVIDIRLGDEEGKNCRCQTTSSQEIKHRFDVGVGIVGDCSARADKQTAAKREI